MKLLLKHFILTALLYMGGAVAMAQSPEAGPVGGDGSNVVIGVLSLIFVGFFVFLVFTDRKLSRLEKEIKNKKS
jgi:CcmD family protein